MTTPIRFDEQVAIVTGAGGGLGRAYALELARRGAKVVVNDRGGARDGVDGGAGGQSAHSPSAAAVVAEIEAAGGTAMADGGDVTDAGAMGSMVARAMDAWGGVHILINNAGILRDKSFAKMPLEDFEAVVRVHLLGSATVTKAVWDIMREQSYGRILMTASSTGLYGNFGQANYGAAKLGVAGLAKTLSLEGARYDIRVNTIAPVAATRMTEDILPDEAFRRFAPEHVVPAALYLVSRGTRGNLILGAGAGVVQAAHVTLTKGVRLPEDDESVEAVARLIDAITDRDGETVPQSGAEQSMAILKQLG